MASGSIALSLVVWQPGGCSMSACTLGGGSSSWQPPTWKAPSRARACIARRGRASVVRYSSASGSHADISIDGALWQDLDGTASDAVSMTWLHGTVHSCPWVCCCGGSCLSRHGISGAWQCSGLHLEAAPYPWVHNTAPMSRGAGRGLAAAEGAAGAQHRLGWGPELDGGQGRSSASGGRLVSTFAPAAARR